MIVCKIYGGIGNQMFQYAFGKRISLLVGKDLKLDISACNALDENHPREFSLESLKVNDLSIASSTHVFLTKKFAKLSNKSGMKYFLPCSKLISGSGGMGSAESNFNLEWFESIKKYKNIYINGYWHDVSYLDPVRSFLLKTYDLPFIGAEDKRVMSSIALSGERSVSLHVRRGDYVSHANTNKVIGVCSLQYYADAIKKITGFNPKAIFYIFSDDIAWARENIAPLIESKGAVEFVDHNNELNGHYDMMLMKNCRHHIIANSTFSWWAAWLSDGKDKKVIAPNQWYSDEYNKYKPKIFPSDWVLL